MTAAQEWIDRARELKQTDGSAGAFGVTCIDCDYQYKFEEGSYTARDTCDCGVMVRWVECIRSFGLEEVIDIGRGPKSNEGKWRYD